MLRLLAFLVGVFFALRVLQLVPGIGWLFRGFFGFWLTAIGLAWALSVLTARWEARRRLQRQIEALGQVDNPHVRGKRGALRLASGDARGALADLESAAAGEAEVAEWAYRLGLARLALGDARAAAAELARAEQLDSDCAYGGVQLALARAELARGEPRRALDALERFERGRDGTAESVYLRGLVLGRMGRGAEARAQFASVPGLVARTPRFQRKAQRQWLWRAWLGRLGLAR
ncbi:MAG: hypothetical protein JNN27_21525 [Planctomycetes bacterium]|nr:hypothetical protein [Planctomycetota bacterium]